MSKIPAAIAVFLVGLSYGYVNPMVWAETESIVVRDFRTDKVGSPPAGFTFSKTGNGHPGRWEVISADRALGGGNVLAQMDADTTDNRFPMAIMNGPPLVNVRLSVRCAAIAGKGDRACGIVFRYHDENNYYIARANALENNVRLYRIKNGHREQFGNWDGKVDSGAWHELRAEARGERFEIYWDGRRVIDTKDRTFRDAGKVGVWTKADSITYFKDLKVESLGFGCSQPSFPSREETRADVFDYIEVLYNRIHRHSHLCQPSPHDFEQAALHQT